jgi:hypothetical protein
MTRTKALSIKTWLKSMGFKLSKSHVLSHSTRKIKYYTLGSFGIYEESEMPANEKQSVKQRFISWTPWGDDFEINSVKDLSKAYEDFLEYNPNMVLA